jgi:flavin reductase (DIM6/NTAB) family NADH-FMN oxidoreductase RutF
VSEAHPAAAPIDPLAYRHVVSRFATGVTVVGTVHEGVRYGMTVNSFTSVSLDPVLALFCCELDASLYEPLMASGIWGVSILPAEAREAATWFATKGVRGVDQFANQRAHPGRVTGAPLLEGALAWLELRTWATYDGGDHTIVVGEVVDVAVGAEEAPLLYYRSDYRTITD